MLQKLRVLSSKVTAMAADETSVETTHTIKNYDPCDGITSSQQAASQCSWCPHPPPLPHQKKKKKNFGQIAIERLAPSAASHFGRTLQPSCSRSGPMIAAWSFHSCENYA